MQSRGDERREFQRLQLDPPLDATYGSSAVTILEIGVLGARIRHDAAPDVRAELRFSGDDQPIAMRCEVVRTIGDESGLRFLAAINDSGDRLRAMLGRIVTKALDDRHESSATRIKVRRNVDGDKTVRTTDAHFVSYRLEDGGWKRRHVFLPEQPAIGFTVARGVDADEMRALCEVYEASDDEGRRLIRLFAELSVSSVLQIPPST
jgi:hypothetical protein